MFTLVLLAACKDDDTTLTSDSATGPEPYALLGDDASLPAAALLSIWGSSSSDVWMVGADDGAGPVVLHYDGAAWSRVDTGSTGDLWWVWSAGDGIVFFSGAAGRMIRHDVAAGTFEEATITNAAYTLFGTWGTSSTDVYSVGGDVTNGAFDGVVMHYDGAAWTEAALAPPKADGITKRQAFKVWGSGPDDVWVVGTQALLMHWDGVAWTDLPAPVYDTSVLTTVHGDGPSNVYAVGGPGNARVARFDGAAWADISPAPTLIVPALNGVFVKGGEAVACGENGSVWRHDGAAWAEEERPVPTVRAFHACWVDDTDAVWAVGGDLTGLTEGVIVRSENSVPPVAL